MLPLGVWLLSGLQMRAFFFFFFLKYLDYPPKKIKAMLCPSIIRCGGLPGVIHRN